MANNQTDSEYFRLAETILKEGRLKKNRTGIDTIGVFGAQAKFDLAKGFPILTTKKVFMKGIIHELLWFIKGDTNIKYLVDNGVHIWDEWAYVRYLKFFKANKKQLEPDASPISQEEFIKNIKDNSEFAKQWGELGEGTYGGMWRKFPNMYNDEHNWGHNEPVDQIKKVLDKLKSNPDDRRMIVSAWHPHWVDHCALPPCHCLFHFNTEELTEEERKKEYVHSRTWGYINPSEEDMKDIPKRRLNLLLYQRSCDTFLGVPFNITSYSLLLAMVAHCVGMQPGVFTHTYGDLHFYVNHLDQIKTQMGREPYEAPKLWLNPAKKDLFDFQYEDILIQDYKCHPAIKGEVAV